MLSNDDLYRKVTGDSGHFSNLMASIAEYSPNFRR